MARVPGTEWHSCEQGEQAWADIESPRSAGRQHAWPTLGMPHADLGGLSMEQAAPAWQTNSVA